LSQFLDTNTPTAEQLKTLPGIGEVKVQSIIKGRPYRPDPKEDHSPDRLPADQAQDRHFQQPICPL
jgi:radical SAM superfamily enzyme with C-terminal helix-hairpin-helix motif